MNLIEFLDIITKKTGASSDTQLAKILGGSPTYISQLRYKNKLTKFVAEKLIGNLLKHNAETSFSRAIHPVVEFFSADCELSKQGAKYEILDQKQHPELVTALKATRGIYAFYNSEGEVIYIGKTSKSNLWNEMNSAYNRARPTYNLYAVNHAHDKWKKNTDEKWRKISKQTWKFYNTCDYFSAYKVEQALIEPIEALLIRVVPNDVSNIKMETGKSGSKKNG